MSESNSDTLSLGNQVGVATASLRRAIVTGEIIPGEQVKEQALARALGMSRTPVREAVRRLVGEGILVQVPNHGATVASWSSREISEIFDVRALLEGYAAGLAAQRADGDAVARLSEMCVEARSMEQRADDAVWDDYAVLNDQFHRGLFGLSQNQKLGTILVGLLAVPLLHRSFNGHRPSAMRRSNQQHEEILDAVAAHDRSWAEAAMQAHVHATRQLLLPQ